MNETNNTPCTITELLALKRVLIPEIQRDYVWGNNTVVIERFLDYISKKESHIGFFHTYKTYGDDVTVSLIDGQQRFTTLVLVYWYLGKTLKANNFQFKVRRNCESFFRELLNCKRDELIKHGNSLKENITNARWYKKDWDTDPTIKAVLGALYIIAKKFDGTSADDFAEPQILYYEEAFSEKSEQKYILINARGCALTLSEQLKAILTEQLSSDEKDKWLTLWEKDWQDILWRCKAESVHNTDQVWGEVLRWARDRYVIDNGLKKENEKGDALYDFDFDICSLNNEDCHLKLLIILKTVIAALDVLQSKQEILQKECNFSDNTFTLKDIISGKKPLNEHKPKVLFYSLLNYCERDFFDERSEFFRVARNLVENTSIDVKDFVDAVNSIKKLAFSDDLLKHLKEDGLPGLDANQKKEELKKIELLKDTSKREDLLAIENNILLKGRIGFILDVVNEEYSLSRLSEIIKWMFKEHGFNNCKDKRLIQRAMLTIELNESDKETDYALHEKSNVYALLKNRSEVKRFLDKDFKVKTFLNHIIKALYESREEFSVTLDNIIEIYLYKENNKISWKSPLIKYSEMWDCSTHWYIRDEGKDCLLIEKFNTSDRDFLLKHGMIRDELFRNIAKNNEFRLWGYENKSHTLLEKNNPFYDYRWLIVGKVIDESLLFGKQISKSMLCCCSNGLELEYGLRRMDEKNEISATDKADCDAIRQNLKNINDYDAVKDDAYQWWYFYYTKELGNESAESIILELQKMDKIITKNQEGRLQ